MAEAAAKDLVDQFKKASREEDKIHLAKSIASAAVNNDIKYMMAREGITKPAVELLKSKTENAQKFGAYMLHCVSYGSDKARSLIGAEGAIPALVDLLPSPHKGVRNQVALTLGSLVKGSNKNKVTLLKSGGVPPLVDLVMTATDAKVLENVTGVLRNLATNVGIAAEICKLNPVPKLLSFLAPGGSDPIQIEAIHVLTNVASHEENRVMLLDNNVLTSVIPLLNSSVADTAAAATELIMLLSQVEALLPKLEAAVDPMIEAWKKTTTPKVKNDATEALRNFAKLERYKYQINGKDAGKAILAPANGPISPKAAHSPKVEKLMKGLEDPDSEKAADAAKTLAEMVNKEGLEFREEVLRAGLFAHLWKQAKQGKLGWEDKWYNTIDSSKLSFKDELGSGAFAIVYKGTYKNKKKEDVAIKAMDENLVNLPDLRCELATMSMLSGIVQNMVEFKGYFYLQQKSKGKIKTVKNYHCIVMELMETNLEDVVHIKKEKLTEAGMRLIAYDIALGMEKIQSFEMLHRDLKPANILLNKATNDNNGGNPQRQYVVKIADFGYARRDTNDSVRKSVVGTPAYLAPELIGQTKSYEVSKATDVYSYGVLLWEMLTGKKPHEGMEINSLYQTVFDAKKSNRPIFPIPNTDSVLKGILEKALLPDPSKRQTFEDIRVALAPYASK